MQPGESFRVYVEAASNPDIGAGFSAFRPSGLGRKSTAPRDPLYVLRQVEVVSRDREVRELVADAWTLRGLMGELPEESPRRAAILAALDEMVDAVDPTDVPGTASAGRASLAAVLSSPAAGTAHTVHAVGHAHIDSAWLWPVRETIRKCARTFSNVLDLMDQDPDVTFACSSAQQFAWIRDSYPELFERVRARVSEGRFIPVGGMWVESDTNMPGGEALARQFIEGKKFFLSELGVDPREVWLPGLLRLLRRAPPDRQSGRSRLLPHPEALLERGEPVPAPHLPLGGHRRHPDLHPLPARRHLQLGALGTRARACRAQLPRQTPREHLAPARSASATAGAAPPGRWSPRRGGRTRSRALRGCC